MFRQKSRRLLRRRRSAHEMREILMTMSFRHYAALVLIAAAPVSLLYAASRGPGAPAPAGRAAAPAPAASPSPAAEPTVEQKARALAEKWKPRFEEEKF